jgi:D-glycero-alpha-D-manno-heptose-7-phosphate kinase
MIITQTPLRVSLFGGGTDFRQFFLREGGAVLSLGIDKYVYVIIKERFDDGIYINYSRKEIATRVDEVQHDLVREALRKTGIEKGVEITTLADVPSEGSGLGSSSSVTVGLLNAFYAYQGEQVPLERLAREACEIEIDILGRPIGIQDQYIAAYGNLRFLEFRKDGAVRVEKLPVPEDRKRQLVSNLMLFYSGMTRSSASVLSEQRQNIPERTEELRRLSDFACQGRECLLSDTCLDVVGHMLHQSWEDKKRLASNVTTPEIDALYERARRAGCLGGKVGGAGSGGFVLMYCPKDKQEQVREALRGVRELPILMSRDGSKVIFNTRGYEWK